MLSSKTPEPKALSPVASQITDFPDMAPVRRLRKIAFCAILFFSVYIVLKLLFQIQTGFCDGIFFLAETSLCNPKPDQGQWDLFYHLGGNGPWISKGNEIHYDEASLPQGCNVDQVHMLSRHAERYPTKNAGARHFDLLNRLQASNVQLTGSLSFLKTWQYFTDPTNPDFENLTAIGPYAGTVQSFNTGTLLRKRYNHLIHSLQNTRFWSCGSGRDIETARHFADGFFGPTWERDGSATLEVIPETEERGADTLTPGDTCINYVQDERRGHDYGYHKLAEWQSVFTKPIRSRLEKDALGVTLTAVDVYGMMEMCGFEILARGSSPWCGVFTHQEWRQFEYARDLLHFYRAGPGNEYAGAMGWLWLNATQALMGQESSTDVYFSFVHDGDIVPVLASLQILNEDSNKQVLSSKHMKSNRRWQTSDVVPMGGRLIFERVACQVTSGESDYYVRLFINDGLMRLPGSSTNNRIDRAMPLEGFRAWIQSLESHFGTFQSICGLDDDVPQRITFLHQ